MLWAWSTREQLGVRLYIVSGGVYTVYLSAQLSRPCLPGREVEAMGTTTQLSLPMACHMSPAVLAACTSACLSSLANPTVGRESS